MKNTHRALYAALVAVMLSAPPQASYAVTIMPLTLVMEHDKRVVTLHVQNDETQAKIFEVQAFRWSQEDGQDRLEPAPDLVVTPPIVKLAPGEEKIIRVGVMQKDNGRIEEKAYRLLLRDITPVESHAGELHLRMQYFLPLFMSPDRTHGGVELVEAVSPDNARCIQITNTGNTHAKLVWTSAESAPASILPTQKYVLAGGQALYCPVESTLDDAQVIAGVTSAYQNEVTSYEVLPPRN